MDYEKLDNLNYEELVEEYKNLKVYKEKLIEKINDNFLEYYQQKNKQDIEKLSEYLKGKIKRIYCLEYKGNYGEWADAVSIVYDYNAFYPGDKYFKTDTDKKIFIVSQSEDWEDTGEGFIEVEDIADETGNNDIMYIIKNIYDEYFRNGVQIDVYI